MRTCRRRCYLKSCTLHRLMLSNTVHTGFGQRLCRMDNPETNNGDACVCKRNYHPSCSKQQKRQAKNLNNPDHHGNWKTSFGSICFWVYSIELILTCGDDFVGTSYLCMHMVINSLWFLQASSSTQILICRKFACASFCPHNYTYLKIYIIRIYALEEASGSHNQVIYIKSVSRPSAGGVCPTPFPHRLLSTFA